MEQPERWRPALDGRHRRRSVRQHGSRLQRVQRDVGVSRHSLRRPRGRRSAGNAWTGGGNADRRTQHHQLHSGSDHDAAGDHVRRTLGRLQRDVGGPGRRLHVLVYRRIRDRGQQPHPDRRVCAAGLRCRRQCRQERAGDRGGGNEPELLDHRRQRRPCRRAVREAGGHHTG